ncbi:3-dehydrosphinganine reductase, partial [Nowakowskiella sp. JEL0407]
MDFSTFFSKFYGELLISLLVTGITIPILATAHVILRWHFSTRFNFSKLEKSVKGKHILISGGSKGLGKSMALDFARAGANVTVLSRGKDIDAATGKSSLDDTLDELKTVVKERSERIAGKTKINISVDQDEQWVKAVKVDALNYQDVLHVVREIANENDGRLPDWVLCFVGGAKPGFVAERLYGESGRTHAENQMNLNYFASTHLIESICKVAKELAPNPKEKQGVDSKDGVEAVAGFTLEQASKLPRKIIFAASGLALVSVTGFTSYCAGKWAVRGYCDSLRQELFALGVKVQMLCLGNIDTPGYEEENKLKPEIAAYLEGTVPLTSPDDVSKQQIAGILSER